MSTKDLQQEWRELAAKVDALIDEADQIQTVQHERMFAIKLELVATRDRIGEIAATGVEFAA